MSGRHKFSDLEAKMSPERRARINRLAAELEKTADSVARKAGKTRADADQPPTPQVLTARSGAAG